MAVFLVALRDHTGAKALCKLNDMENYEHAHAVLQSFNYPVKLLLVKPVAEAQ